jgi:DNA-binding NarL/FixJ family response regulator
MSDQPQIRVFSVDDHPLLREGIAAIINNQPDMLIRGAGGNWLRSDSNVPRASSRCQAHGSQTS